MRRRAFSLIEVLVAAGIAALLALAGGALALGSRPLAMREAEADVAAWIDVARGAAAESGDGATLTFSPAPGGGSRVDVSLHRPMAGDALEPSGTQPYRAPVRIFLAGGTGTAATFALFVASGGTVSAAPWSVGMGALAVEPPCSGALTLVFSDGARSERRSVPCDQAFLR